MDRGKVILSQGGGGDVIATSVPPHAGRLHPTERCFSDIQEARDAWSGLRLCLGRQKVDLTGEG